MSGGTRCLIKGKVFVTPVIRRPTSTLMEKHGNVSVVIIQRMTISIMICLIFGFSSQW